jgi:predicted MFS family arabinose efflux permease
VLLRQRDFTLYFAGCLISNIGTWLQSTAQILIAYQVTHSVFAVGLVTSAQFAGMILVSPWAAVLADRIGTKPVLIGAQATSAFIALWMAWRYQSGLLGIHTLLVGALALGFVYALALPIQTALLPALVGKADTTYAVKLNSVAYNAGRALAPALCVPLIALAGPDFIFGLNAVSFTVFGLCLARIRSHRARDMDRKAFRGSPAGNDKPNGRPRVTDGLKTALHHPRILLLLAIVAAVTLADDPILVLSPALTHAKMHISGEWAGYFIAALGWGSVIGSLPPASDREADVRQSSRRAALYLLILGVSVIIFAMGFSPEASLLAAVTAGAAALFTGAAAQTALLRHHQDMAVAATSSVVGVAALWAIAWAGTKPFASLLDGWLAVHIGIVPTSIALVFPAVTIAATEIFLPPVFRQRIRILAAKCSLRLVRTLSR